MTDQKLKKLIIPIDPLDEESKVSLEMVPFDIITWVCTDKKNREKRHSFKLILN